MKQKPPVYAVTITIVILVFSWLMIERAKAEPEQQIILVPIEPIIIEQSDPDDELTNTYIYQEGEKPVVCTPAGEGAIYCI